MLFRSDEVDAVVEVELGHEAAAMSLNCLGADDEGPGYLLVGVALRDQLEHVLLPVRELVVRVAQIGRASCRERV